MLAMSRFTLQIDFATAVRSRVVQNLGLAFLFVPVSTAAFANIAKERTNYAAGRFNLTRNIGGSSGIAAGTTLLACRSQFHEHVLVSHLTPYDLPLREVLSRASSILQVRGGSAPNAAIPAHGPALWHHAPGIQYAGIFGCFLGYGDAVPGRYAAHVFYETPTRF